MSSLTTLLEHAQVDRDAALRVLRQAEVIAEAARAQAVQLGDYRGEYRQRWAQRFTQASAALLLHSHHAFAQRLDQAITLQSASTEQADARQQRAAHTLRICEQRVAAVGKLIERRRASARLAEQRAEQRQQDEAAARVGARLQSSHPLF